VNYVQLVCAGVLIIIIIVMLYRMTLLKKLEDFDMEVAYANMVGAAIGFVLAFEVVAMLAIAYSDEQMSGQVNVLAIATTVGSMIFPVAWMLLESRIRTECEDTLSMEYE
jgi:uncharacterized protein YacL